MNHIQHLHRVPGLLVVVLGLLVPGTTTSAEEPAKGWPNILWITAEDHGPHLGCYGDRYANTPNLDALAGRGMMYTRCWSTVPVCAPARTALITGMYPSSLGGEHMRSLVPLPEGVKMYPQLLREAGYYCTNNSKTDYNVAQRGMVWDESSGKAHWKNRKEGQPFFAIFNFTGTHESQVWSKAGGLTHDPKKAKLPAFHPDTPEVRADWAKYHDNITRSDQRAGVLLKELTDAGLAEDTIVFYYADHGAGMPRGKRSACNFGLQVPLIVYFPEKWRHLAPREYKAGGKSDRLVNFVDMAPTVVSLAGNKPPEWMQGLAFAGPHQTEPPAYMHGMRARMDARYDLVRCVTDGRYVYVRNYMTHVPHIQYVHYQFRNDTTRTWKRLFDEGKLSEEQAAFWKTPRPTEELYDLTTDPYEVKNLAGLGEHARILQKLRDAHREHTLRIRDVSLLPEADMIARSAGGSPYDMARKADVYPIEEVLKAAELASSQDAGKVNELTALLNHPDAGVRFWAVLGLRLPIMEKKVPASTLMDRLGDKSPSVRIAAAEVVVLHGNDDQARQGAETLVDVVASHPNNVHVLLEALNAMDHAGNRLGLADKAEEVVKALPNRNPKWENRGASGIGSLKPDVLGRLMKKE